MKEIRRSISEELRRLAETYRATTHRQQREKGVQAALDDAVSNSQMTAQAQCPAEGAGSNSQTYRTIYENFLETATTEASSSRPSDHRSAVTSTASRPGRRSSPSTLLVLLVGRREWPDARIGIGIIMIWPTG